ncbi:kinesin-domain-containing protein [Ramaria rubella]|nr:kinesin-domain-containing protein [Ramaria rubella]
MAAKVKVAARLRPFINTENPDTAVIVSPADGSISIANLRNANERFKFSFSSCYDQSASQEEIFTKDVRPLVDHVFNGLICTVFAYGVTSSGKTHTIQGNTAEPGIIPRVVKALIDQKNQYPQGTISLSVSYMEIYKDEAYDLLVPRENAPKLPIREDPSGKIVVANLSDKPIASVQDFDRIFSPACKSRSTGATNLNHASSRSHAVLAITVTKVDALEQKVLTGKINLVDLAGSENNKLTGNDPARMAESAAINKSLTVLGQVVHALNTNASRIPYRDSKLTRILQDALGGSSLGLLICNLAPGMKFRQDTLNTLNFASRTKEIQNQPTVNERDTRPPPKLHFAAVAQAPPPARPAFIPRAIPGPSRMSMGGGASYQTLAAPNAGAFGFNATGRYSIGGAERIIEASPTPQLQEQADIDAKISRAVQQEVERRLAEREAQEQERFAEFERRERERATERERVEDEQRALLMKKHDDLNKLLKKTLRKAEKENQKMSGGAESEKVISPKKSKKLAMAYVSLGRDYLQSKEPDYNGALKLWQQAETYVPENKALKKRITELQIAIREGVTYRLGKRQKGLLHHVESPVSGSPSGSRDHKESHKLRRKARLALAKDRGELDPSALRTPSPRKAKSKKDVFLQDSDDELLVSEGC